MVVYTNNFSKKHRLLLLSCEKLIYRSALQNFILFVSKLGKIVLTNICNETKTDLICPSLYLFDECYGFFILFQSIFPIAFAYLGVFYRSGSGLQKNYVKIDCKVARIVKKSPAAHHPSQKKKQLLLLNSASLFYRRKKKCFSW